MAKRKKESDATSEKRLEAVATSTAGEAISLRFEGEYVDWELFPALPSGVERVLYATGDIGEPALRLLNDRGYTVVDPRTMPRGSTDETHRCINGWLQGMSEGTIPYSPERRRMLELELRSHGLLVNRSLRLEGNVTLEGATLEQLFEFGNTQPTIKPITEEELAEARRAALNPGDEAMRKAALEADRQARTKKRKEEN